MKRKIAVFDFDGTLTTKDTLIEFIRFCKGSRSLYLGLLRYSLILVLMVLKLYDNSKSKELVLAYFFKGVKYSTFKQLGERFASIEKNLLNPNTYAILKKHLEDGDDVYVVTASVVEWVRPFCLSLGVKEVLGTQMEVNADGVLTGKFSSPNCYGGEKVRRFLAMEPDRDSYELYAYGDSEGDREMFALADHYLKVKH